MNPQLREMMERYLAGDLSEIELEAFLTLVRNDAEALAELKQAMLQQAMLCDLLRRPQEQVRKGSRVTPAVGTSGLRPAASGGRPSVRTAAPSSSTRLRAAAETQPAKRESSARRAAVASKPWRPNRWQASVAAAALLIVTLGLIALWLNVSTDRDTVMAEQNAKRRQAILKQLAELEREAEAARFRPVLPPPIEPALPKPQPPREEPSTEPSEPSNAEAIRLAEEAQRRRETEEVTQLIEARRQQLMAQLRSYPERRPRGDDTDEDNQPLKTPKPGTAVASVASGEADVEVGQIVFVESEQQSGVVVRGEDKEEVRLGLRKGLRLNRGDRVETAAGNAPACAVVELAGGATLDLDQKTVVEVLERDEARLDTGRIYASIPLRDEGSDAASAGSFSLQTRTGRYLTQEARAEIFASPDFTTPRTSARVDGGRLHLINSKGVVAGHKGQEIQAQSYLAPQRADLFSAPIWRGRDLPKADLPFTKSNLLIFSNENPTRWFTEDYAMVLAHRGEVRLAGLQVSQGNLGDPQRQFQLLARETYLLARMGMRNLPHPAQGVLVPLPKPASGKAEETRPESSAAVMQILASARVATPAQPLVVVCTGSLTDVASAWLFDRGIAERVVVVGPFAGSGIEWSFDPWAAELVVSHFRCIVGGGPSLVLDKDRLSRMADSRWVKFAGKATGGDPEFCKLGFVTIPGLITETQRARFVGVVGGQPRFEPDPQGRIWLVKKTDRAALLREFDQTFLRPGR